MEWTTNRTERRQIVSQCIHITMLSTSRYTTEVRCPPALPPLPNTYEGCLRLIFFS